VGILSVVAYKVIVMYTTRRKFPPGPIPRPFIGNFSFKPPINHPHDVSAELVAEYGKVFTLWIGPNPTVVVYDTKTCLEVLKSKAVAGRPKFSFAHEISSRPGSLNIPFSDYSRENEVLRKVTVAAIRKYATSDSLSQHVVHVTDQFMEKILKNKNDIDIHENLQILLLQLLATSAFGKNYSLEDQEFQAILKAMDTLNDTDRVFFTVGLNPLLKYFFLNQWNRAIKSSRYLKRLISKRFNEHEETYQVQENRDFMDSLIWARVQAKEDEDAELLKSVDTWTIQNSVSNLFNAGSQTSKMTLNWWFLHLSMNPEMQKRIRKDVDAILPNDDDIPTIDMKEKTPYLMAFISEVLRFKSVTPFALPHKTIEDTVIGGYKVPKDTTVLLSLHTPMADESVWKDPKTFNPERFLEATTGKFIQRPNNCFLPFSTGRRSCIGEKLALTNIFLICMRILQKTRGMMFEVNPAPKTPKEIKQLYKPDITKLTFYEPSTKYHLRLVDATKAY
jgi:cytochrome P450